LKVGVNILNFGPGANPRDLLRWAQVSETLGYHSVLISDHIAITPAIAERYPAPYYDAFATLAWLAGQTKRVQLGTTVIVLPYRHPILMARMVANIDQFSDGRFIFGVGIGVFEEEFEALGQPYHRRGALADESLQAMIALWEGDGPVSFHGKLVNFEAVSAIKTKQQPRPPIWIGGNTPSAFARVSRLGDAWHPILWRSMTIDYVATTALPEIRRLSAEAGLPMPKFCPRIRLELTDKPVEGEREAGVGSLAQIKSDIAALRDLGAEHVTLDWFTGDLEASRNHAHGWQMLATLADQVFDLDAETLR
jgi:probable F420-dependent oxidoreductase